MANWQSPALTIRTGETSCKSLSGHSNLSHRHLVAVLRECVCDINDMILMRGEIYKYVCVKERHLMTKIANFTPATAVETIHAVYLYKTTFQTPPPTHTLTNTHSPVCSLDVLSAALQG